MNIKITYNWLLEYLDTNADPYELQKYLSLCGPSVERVDKVGDDYVLDIEVTSNRVDMASVFGIAQEAQAILPQFGKRAKLKVNPLEKHRFNVILGSAATPESGKRDSGQARMTLKVQIKDPKLCPRFSALVLSDVSIKKTPDVIRKRLQNCGIKSINNVIDISNYLMLALGQPTHIFDYDEIGKATMILRESRKGEKIVTLDEKEVTLPGGDIVIEDGNGKLIDLCGIMGGFNSSVTKKTKNIVLFLQAYNKQKIRRTSMATGQRTMAATYFEKGLDAERVAPTMAYGVELLAKYANANVASALIDIYPEPYKPKTVSVVVQDIQSRMGVKLDTKQVVKILSDLGFVVKTTGDKIVVAIPSWRKDDVSIKEDLVEEIARIYGYHNLPVNMPSSAYVKRSSDMDNIFAMQQKIKFFFKHLGLHEVMNYSMVSEKMLKQMNLELKHHLKLSNPISKDLAYMRTSLLPSLVNNVRENQGKREILKFFEISKVYYPQPHDLPKEIYKVALIANTSFSDLKGIAEQLLWELNIENYEVKTAKIHIFSKNEVVDYVVDGGVIGSVGKLTTELQLANGLKRAVYLASFDLLSLIQHAQVVSKFKPINPHAVIKLDLTLNIRVYSEFVKKAHTVSAHLKKIELIDSFKNKKTVRLYFSSTTRNLTEKEAQGELAKISKLT